MLYRKLNKSGDDISILGFGCMRLPTVNGRIDEEKATRQIRHAVDMGVNYFDAGMHYHMGACEPFLGRALSEGYRARVKIATKMPPPLIHTREDMDRILSVQLDNLRTDHIDYYLLHGLDGRSFGKLSALGISGFLDKARADGRIRFPGFSFHGDIESFKRIIDSYDWHFCQIQYNYLDEHNQAGTEGLRYAAEKGLGVVVMEPLRGGHLTEHIPPQVQKIWQEAMIKRSPAEWALRWVWNHAEVSVVLSGMNRDEHIDENLRIANQGLPNSMSSDELDIVARAVEAYQKLMKIGCTGCRYCMPCPSGVDIPSCFELYNQDSIFGDKKIIARSFYFYRLGPFDGRENLAYASQCKSCGKCEEACPQHLPIRERLADVAAKLEGPWLKLFGKAMTFCIEIERWRTMRKAKRIHRRGT